MPEDTIDTSELLVSELVTNAVRHARIPAGRQIEVACELKDGRLRVEVADACESWPQARTATDDAESGRGLHLVDTLADKWGVSPRDGVGKVVWFVLEGDVGKKACGVATYLPSGFSGVAG